eukprot:TRINITY_DN10987_c0_g1_i1.p1 TRINITY_DN10987_c0_g1~~TRINITY_DN10987_c0_g1_i1.p1  ORF type:complete len:229 (-),score=43.20 TRINITY_DN10987_c0_g1_i1:20-706(-)
MLLFVLSTLLSVSLCQDPASGWMGYAQGNYPTGRITYIEAKWVVGNNPVQSGSFFSPWFGIEASDNLNLLQPVNPWLEDHWEIYNEYFQWNPINNINSDSHTVQPGDILFGSITFNENNQSYTLLHTDLTDGWSVSTNIGVQQNNDGTFKNYTIIYFVMEKSEWDCDQYPPDGKVVFYDIVVEYDGVKVTPKWTTNYVDDNCNCRAAVVNPTTIQITWDVNYVKYKIQ